jgi:hypothetical protein
VIAVTKANLIKPGMHGMRCEVRSVTLSSFTPPIETSELVLLGKCEISADDLLMPSAERTTRNEAASGWTSSSTAGGASVGTCEGGDLGRLVVAQIDRLVTRARLQARSSQRPARSVVDRRAQRA